MMKSVGGSQNHVMQSLVVCYKKFALSVNEVRQYWYILSRVVRLGL